MFYKFCHVIASTFLCFIMCANCLLKQLAVANKVNLHRPLIARLSRLD
jgi:hypothetical protein